MTKTGLHKEDSKKLLAELKKDGTKINRLYPMATFDEVTVSNGKIALKKRFNHEQTARFLSIVNDPTSFNWSEITSKPDIQVAFLKNGKMVGVLNIESDKLVVKPSPELPGFLKMKLGTLNAEPRQKLVDLFAEIGY
ncbi:hypothetical protein [Fluviicola taffensis]|nr:hypothetical protein [Fluviicola taffensis]